MKLFQVSGVFEAEDIDDAFAVLGEHFTDLAEHGLNGLRSDRVLSMDVRVTESERPA